MARPLRVEFEDAVYHIWTAAMHGSRSFATIPIVCGSFTS